MALGGDRCIFHLQTLHFETLYESVIDAREADMAEVSHGLNLFLKLKKPSEMEALSRLILSIQPDIYKALDSLHYVHFARFLPSPDGSMLMVITEFDGEKKPYVMDFAAVIGTEFTKILEFIEDAPPLPVQKHPREFWDFVERNSQQRVPLWSAYKDKTVLDILRSENRPPSPIVDARPAHVEVDDIQGNVLRGYGSAGQHAHHLALSISDAQAARAFIGELSNGGNAEQAWQVTSGQDWPDNKTDQLLLNIGLTHLGLEAIGVAPATLRLFPEAFRMGPADPQRARPNGDTGDSAPRTWTLGNPDQQHVHLMLSLYARSEGLLNAKLADLEQRLASAGLNKVFEQRTQALPNKQLHFGYRDSIAQPNLAMVGAKAAMPDQQPTTAVGDFLLGKEYVNHAGGNFIDRLPAALCDNGTYAAVRIMEQDVKAFEKLITELGQTLDLDPELIAAKLMGRWRNGAPLSAWPDSDGGTAPADEDINNFDFRPNTRDPNQHDDAEGLRCPVGAHIRRMNPRGALVAGKPHSHRLIRRGMPYGSLYNPKAHSDQDNEKRGLFGIFICGDLESQFEFLLQVWANGDLASTGIRGTHDPIIGSQHHGGRFIFTKPGSAQPIEITVPKMVRTVGSVYLFMPSIKGLQHLAAMTQPTPSPQHRPLPSPASQEPPMPTPLDASFNPSAFNPHDKAFVADPYPTYAWFRQNKPVHLVGGQHGSHWVFSHELVSQVLSQKDVFLKNRHPPKLENKIGDVMFNLTENGLFFMDPPRHTEVREMLDPLFAKAIEGVETKVNDIAADLIGKIARPGSFDLVGAYAQSLTAQVFADMFGIPLSQLKPVVGWTNSAMASNNKGLTDLERFPGFTSRLALGGYMQALRPGCPMGAQHMMSQMRTHAEAPANPMGLSPIEFQQTAVHFALGGYLSTQFLISTGMLNLLKNPTQLGKLITTPGHMPNAVQEMLRFDAAFAAADRYVAQETKLGDVVLMPGDKVTLAYGSANRDEKVYANPDAFDITRQPDKAKPHFALGGGIHYCIGAPLVEIVVPLAISKLITTLTRLEIDTSQALDWGTDPYFRAPSRLMLLTD